MKQQTERVYVKAKTDFDTTGYMLPKKIIWSDGRCFSIDEVRDFRPADLYGRGRSSACYIIIIHGEERCLFFERTSEQFPSRFGRWFVEKTVSDE